MEQIQDRSLEEHKADCHLGQTEKSAVAEREQTLTEPKHVLAITSSYHSSLNGEAIEIPQHKNNFKNK